MLVQLITERERGEKGGRRMIFRLLLYARMNAVDVEMAIKEEGGCGTEGKRKALQYVLTHAEAVD